MARKGSPGLPASCPLAPAPRSTHRTHADGRFEVAGVPRDFVPAFSPRRAEVEVALALASGDRVIGLQGFWGPGKDPILDRLRAIAVAVACLVTGLALCDPEARALQGRSGIERESLARFLARHALVAWGQVGAQVRQGPRNSFERTPQVVDRASLVSRAPLGDLRRAVASLRVDRLVLLGNGNGSEGARRGTLHPAAAHVAGCVSSGPRSERRLPCLDDRDVADRVALAGIFDARSTRSVRPEAPCQRLQSAVRNDTMLALRGLARYPFPDRAFRQAIAARCAGAGVTRQTGVGAPAIVLLAKDGLHERAARSLGLEGAAWRCG